MLLSAFAYKDCRFAFEVDNVVSMWGKDLRLSFSYLFRNCFGICKQSRFLESLFVRWSDENKGIILCNSFVFTWNNTHKTLLGKDSPAVELLSSVRHTSSMFSMIFQTVYADKNLRPAWLEYGSACKKQLPHFDRRVLFRVDFSNYKIDLSHPLDGRIGGTIKQSEVLCKKSKNVTVNTHNGHFLASDRISRSLCASPWTLTMPSKQICCGIYQKNPHNTADDSCYQLSLLILA